MPPVNIVPPVTPASPPPVSPQPPVFVPPPRKSKWPLIIGALFVLSLLAGAAAFAFFYFKNSASPQQLPTTTASTTSSYQSGLKYLGFQVGGAMPAMPGQSAEVDSKAKLESRWNEVIQAIGQRGDGVHTQLGFWIGPIGWDLSDVEQRKLIDDAFAAAEEKDVAVGFHIDDSMFWNARRDLWSNKNNVEWSDWDGTIIPHRIIGWAGNSAPILAPPMCYNSPAIIKETKRLATDVIGAQIKKNVDRLTAEGKGHLFMGVITGWETRLQDDTHDPHVYSGYCALTNLGYSAAKPPADKNATLITVVSDWVTLWTKSISQAGIPKDKIFTHIALNVQGDSITVGAAQDAPPWVAFTNYSNPGFSLYGTSYSSALGNLLSEHGNPPWGISEGTVVELLDSFSGGTASISLMESYLAGVFNHGGIYVDIFGWSDGTSDYAKSTMGTSSIAAYQKFLKGEKLVEAEPASGAPSTSAPQGSFQTKIQKIQKELPQWIGQNQNRQKEMESLMQKMDGYIKANNPKEAEKIADEILSIIGG